MDALRLRFKVFLRKLAYKELGVSSKANEGFIYLIEFDNGVLKAGKSVSPHKRLLAVQGTAWPAQMLRNWVSPLHTSYGENERTLLTYCKMLSTSSQGEYFTGVDFSDALDYAQRLPFAISDDTLRFEKYLASDKALEDIRRLF